MSANILPDDILRGIFAFCLSSYRCPFNCHGYWLPLKHTTEWQRLVHVCQRWRQIIYGSPRYFDLHLYCSVETHFRKSLSRWPEFPITIDYIISWEEDNVIAALEHPDRVHRVNLIISYLDAGERDVLELMEVPFPALTYLNLTGPGEENDGALDLPDQFLGGSAPCLEHLCLAEISFPALPKLLLSARGLVTLELENNTAIGYKYISPAAIVGGLAGLIRLKTLCIKFPFPDPDAELEEGRHSDPPMHAVLPALTEFVFRGGNEYLEDLMAQIDTPRLEGIEIEYFTPEIEIRQLYQFLGRIANLEFDLFKRAQVTFDPYDVSIKLELDRPQGEYNQIRFSLTVKTSYHENYRVQCIVRVLGQLVAMLSNVDHLSVNHLSVSKQFWRGRDDIMKTLEWLPLLRLFPAVEVLHVFGRLAGHLATVLEDIAEERVTEVLPALHSLWLGDDDGLVVSTERFLSLRQLSGRPINVVNTEDKFVE